MGRMPSVRWVGAAELLACALDGKHPVDTSTVAIAAALPVRDLRDERGFVGDATVEALPDHHPDLDLDHVEPARVLGREMELDAAQDASGFCRREALV